VSLSDFWMSIRTAVRLLVPGASVDSPLLDSAAIERGLRGAAIWLTPASVEGFDPNDFVFLPHAERQTLTEAVERFRDVARQVPPNQPATEEQIRQALPEFQRIVEILRPDKYADPEALVIGKRIEQHLANRLPEFVAALRFETGEDHTGAPALWIWVILKDEAAEEEVLGANMRTVRDLFQRMVKELKVGRWPFFRVRTVSELEPPAKKARQ